MSRWPSSTLARLCLVMLASITSWSLYSISFSTILQLSLYVALGYVLCFTLLAGTLPARLRRAARRRSKLLHRLCRLRGVNIECLISFVVPALTVAYVYNVGWLESYGMRRVTGVAAVLFTIVLIVSAWLQLQWAVIAAQWLFPYLTWCGPGPEETGLFQLDDDNETWPLVDEETGKPLIALSIDDVPCTFEKFGPSAMDSCLDVLKEHGATATLFVMARELAKHDDFIDISDALVKAVQRGCELGNHDLLDVKTALRHRKDFVEALRECDDTIGDLMARAGKQWSGWRDFYDDPDEETYAANELHKPASSVAASSKMFFDKMAIASKVPEDPSSPSSSSARRRRPYRDPLQLASSGDTIKWFRPGGGFFSKDMTRLAAKHGYSTVLGSCFPFDTHLPAFHNEAYVLMRARPGKIIVIHDRPRLLQTLRKLLPKLCTKYKVVSLSQLFEAAAKARKRQKISSCSLDGSDDAQNQSIEIPLL
eukprot:TRINITY_DN47113_c0_g1_i1.p1 TRINITY_DN47113_c0_g1~~TRINITY_DN47113_c0_g1_i1.p1  ORF type:complete len:481 (-),score=97.73 TRINITY_DN47113_c0_g1_i1:32-1474(-)